MWFIIISAVPWCWLPRDVNSRHGFLVKHILMFWLISPISIKWCVLYLEKPDPRDLIYRTFIPSSLISYTSLCWKESIESHICWLAGPCASIFKLTESLEKWCFRSRWKQGMVTPRHDAPNRRGLCIYVSIREDSTRLFWTACVLFRFHIFLLQAWGKI